MKRVVAIILELIPIIAAPVFFILVLTGLEFEGVKIVIPVAMLCAFLGFIFFFIGRKIAKGDGLVLLFGILDWLATAAVIAFYVIAIFNFGT